MLRARAKIDQRDKIVVLATGTGWCPAYRMLDKMVLSNPDWDSFIDSEVLFVTYEYGATERPSSGPKGEIRAKLEELGIAESTLLFFFSDNGPDFGSAGPLRGKKGTNWEGGHRVPAVAWWPGTIEPGLVSDDLAITLNVMPTILQLSGLEAVRGKKFDGVSLVPVLKGGGLKGERRLFWNDKAMRDGSGS